MSQILKPARTVDGRAVILYTEVAPGRYPVLGAIAKDDNASHWDATGAFYHRDHGNPVLDSRDLRTEANFKRWATWDAFDATFGQPFEHRLRVPITDVSKLDHDQAYYAWIEDRDGVVRLRVELDAFGAGHGSSWVCAVPRELYDLRRRLPVNIVRSSERYGESSMTATCADEAVTADREPAVPRYVAPPFAPVPPHLLQDQAEAIGRWFEAHGIKDWELGPVRARFTSRGADVAEIKRLEGVVQVLASQRDEAREQRDGAWARLELVETQLAETQRQRDGFACAESTQRQLALHAAQEVKTLRQSIRALL